MLIWLYHSTDWLFGDESAPCHAKQERIGWFDSYMRPTFANQWRCNTTGQWHNRHGSGLLLQYCRDTLYAHDTTSQHHAVGCLKSLQLICCKVLTGITECIASAPTHSSLMVHFVQAGYCEVLTFVPQNCMNGISGRACTPSFNFLQLFVPKSTNCSFSEIR